MDHGNECEYDLGNSMMKRNRMLYGYYETPTQIIKLIHIRILMIKLILLRTGILKKVKTDLKQNARVNLLQSTKIMFRIKIGFSTGSQAIKFEHLTGSQASKIGFLKGSKAFNIRFLTGYQAFI